MNYFCFKKSIAFNFFMQFVVESETNKDKSTEIFPPLLLKPTESKKSSAKDFNFKKRP